MPTDTFSLQELQPYLQAHPGRGALRIQVSTALGTFPVSQAIAEVSVILDGNRIPLYRKLTDESGVAEDFFLPAKPVEASRSAATAADSATIYRVSVSHPNYIPLVDQQIKLFTDVKTILPVVLEPLLL